MMIYINIHTNTDGHIIITKLVTIIVMTSDDEVQVKQTLAVSVYNLTRNGRHERDNWKNKMEQKKPKKKIKLLPIP